MEDHKDSSRQTVVSAKPLSQKFEEQICTAAAYCAAIDNRPLLFAERSQKGMKMFLMAIFQTRQSVPVGEVISPAYFMPSRTAVTSVLRHVTLHHLQQFAQRLKSDVIENGGAISIDGIT